MCTAISHSGKSGHYFGRNLDLEFCYRESVTVMPRSFPLKFRCGFTLQHHYAMIGMATVAAGYPLFYDATNERGLSLAGLNFPGNAAYRAKACAKDNIAPFELIPWILGRCASVQEALQLLRRINIWNLPFSREFPLTPLHWLLADEKESIVIEQIADGLHLYQNPIGVLTNNPPFPCQMNRLADFAHLSNKQPSNRFDSQQIKPYSNGMGGIGLPGDYSSPSRFAKAAFVKFHSDSQANDVPEFFHILSSVAMPRGSILIRDEQYEITQYSSCCDTQRGIYYYTTYENSRISAVDMHKCPIHNRQLVTYPLRRSPDIHYEN